MLSIAFYNQVICAVGKKIFPAAWEVIKCMVNRLFYNIFASIHYKLPNPYDTSAELYFNSSLNQNNKEPLRNL